MRILYVEDDARDVDLVRRTLAREAPAHELLHVGSLASALEAIVDQPVDLALVDLRLPDGNGLDLVRAIRARGLSTAVVVVTGQGDEESAIEALRADADDYLIKGHDYLPDLLATLDSARRRRRRMRRHDGTLRVLYVEHNPLDLDLTRRHLAAEAPHIRLDDASSATAALERLAALDEADRGWDVLLVDYRLPGATGLDLLKAVRAGRRADLPVVLVTGQGNEETAALALRFGATDYVVKHVSYLRELPFVLESAHHRHLLARERRALRESRAMLDAVIESALDAIVSIDEQHRVVLFNAAAESMFGIPRREILGQPLDRLLPARLREEHDRHVRGFAAADTESRAMGEERLVVGLRADGSEFPLEASIARARTDTGQLLTAVLHDVTARRLAAERLAEAQERLRVAVDAADVGLWDWNLDSDRVRYSDVWKRQIGYLPEEIGDSTEEWRSRVHPDDLPVALERVRSVIEGRAPVYQAEFRFRHRDGSYRDILARGRLLTADNGRAQRLIGSHIDLTERVALEAQLRQSQKMESVGRLAGGVAHDFNNLLTVINNYADLLASGLAEGTEAHDMVREIGDAGRRAAALTQRLLAFSRQQVVRPQPTSLNQVIRSLRSILGRLIGEDVLLEVDAAPDLGLVEADPSQLEQVLMNLAVNARDAMPEGGRLTIRTRNVDGDEPLAGGAVPAGAWVRLEVRDSGSGIPPPAHERLFEPFFTTKPSGTGLGLSTVHGIVRQSGGHINARNDPEGGATFEIHFPRTLAKPLREPTTETAVPSPPSGSILVVEDEPAVRELTRRMLERFGFEVRVSGSAEEALESLRTNGSVDLLLTDVVMPRVSGIELAERVRSLHPATRVLLTSGYADDTARSQGIGETSHVFLGKPYSRQQLVDAVQRAMRSPL